MDEEKNRIVTKRLDHAYRKGGNTEMTLETFRLIRDGYIKHLYLDGEIYNVTCVKRKDDKNG